MGGGPSCFRFFIVLLLFDRLASLERSAGVERGQVEESALEVRPSLLLREPNTRWLGSVSAPPPSASFSSSCSCGLGNVAFVSSYLASASASAVAVAAVAVVAAAAAAAVAAVAVAVAVAVAAVEQARA